MEIKKVFLALFAFYIQLIILLKKYINIKNTDNIINSAENRDSYYIANKSDQDKASAVS